MKESLTELIDSIIWGSKSLRSCFPIPVWLAVFNLIYQLYHWLFNLPGGG